MLQPFDKHKHHSTEQFPARVCWGRKHCLHGDHSHSNTVKSVFCRYIASILSGSVIRHGLALQQGRGFYVGIALWPGGSVEDWLPSYDSTTGEWGLNPCNVTADFNNTGLTPSQYLVRRMLVPSSSCRGGAPHCLVTHTNVLIS